VGEVGLNLVEAGAEAVHICLQLRHRGDALDLSWEQNLYSFTL
jgi:hypothetical protein